MMEPRATLTNSFVVTTTLFHRYSTATSRYDPGLLLVDHACLNWFNEGVRAALRERRRAERKWRRTNLPEHLVVFKRAKNYASNQLNTARTKYLSDFISENSQTTRENHSEQLMRYYLNRRRYWKLLFAESE